jgi:hypothetical protein
MIRKDLSKLRFLFISSAVIFLTTVSTPAQDFQRDLYSDTWAASDALGRKMPSFEEVGPVKTDKQRFVSIFYVTWHTLDYYASRKSPYCADVSKILKADPNARFDANHPLWTDFSYHWGEPEMDYFLSQDEYVIRKDLSMLSDAGVDVLVMDLTNAVRYWDEWEKLFSTMHKMKADGNKVPHFCFWTFNGEVITATQDIYDSIYKKNRFKDLWFYWEGKPLLLYNSNPLFDADGHEIKQPNKHYDPSARTDVNNPHYGNPDYTEEFYRDYTKEVKDFFTCRMMWWGFYKWDKKRFVGTEDNWSFGYDLSNDSVKALNPDNLVSTHMGQKEEAAVTPASHPNRRVGKSWRRETGQPQLNQYDLVDSAYVPWLGKTVKNPEGYGIYFQDRWDEALKTDPQFIYMNDWNEWTAPKFPPENGKTARFMRRDSPHYFVDQYNSEFNRTIQPMKNGYSDNYYMQMAQNIRKYKGIRPIPELHGYNAVNIDGQFTDWKNIVNEFRDTKGDTFHRDFNGYGGLHYENESGRNDIITSKIAVDKKSILFYAETNGEMTSWKDPNWMMLFIDADNNSETGWYGYDYLINKKVKSENKTVLMHYDSTHTENPWVEIADLKYRYSGKELEIAIPRKLIGFAKSRFTFDFKWSDNAADLTDPISFCIAGDSAPNRRFNYRCIWKE